MQQSERGSALIVVLIAILVMLPPTLLLARMAFRWQRHSLDFRDTLDEEFVAYAGFEEARNRLTDDGMDLEPNEGTTFRIRGFESHTTSARVSREEDIVLSQDGLIITGTAAKKADLEVVGVDAEGRYVYRYRKLGFTSLGSTSPAARRFPLSVSTALSRGSRTTPTTIRATSRSTRPPRLGPWPSRFASSCASFGKNRKWKSSFPIRPPR